MNNKCKANVNNDFAKNENNTTDYARNINSDASKYTKQNQFENSDNAYPVNDNMNNYSDRNNLTSQNNNNSSQNKESRGGCGCGSKKTTDSNYTGEFKNDYSAGKNNFTDSKKSNFSDSKSSSYSDKNYSDKNNTFSSENRNDSDDNYNDNNIEGFIIEDITIGTLGDIPDVDSIEAGTRNYTEDPYKTSNYKNETSDKYSRKACNSGKDNYINDNDSKTGDIDVETGKTI